MDSVRQRILDRYEMDELIEVLKLDIEDILNAFEDKVEEAINNGYLDIE